MDQLLKIIQEVIILLLPYRIILQETVIKITSFFANLIQWIEPLIASAFHSCDDRAIGNNEKYTNSLKDNFLIKDVKNFIFKLFSWKEMGK